MRSIEQQGGTNGIILAAGTEHSLGDVTPSSRFGTRIITRPPLYSQGHQQDRHPHRGVI